MSALARMGLVMWVFVGLIDPEQATAQAQRTQPAAEGVVAWVGGEGPGRSARPILRSDVDLIAWLSGRTPVGERPSRDALRDSLSVLVREWIVWLEAQRLGEPSPSERELRAERRRLLERVGGADQVLSELERIGVGNLELQAVAERRATVGAFLARTVRGRDVSEQEVEQRIASAQHPFVGTDASQVRSAVRVWLQRQQHEQAIGRWVRALAQRSPVHYLAAWATGGDDASDGS